MYKILNNVENQIIKSFNTDDEFVDFIKKIASENDDDNILISNKIQAINYLQTYCSNLELK